MDELINILDTYGIIVVIAGCIASILCGLIKLPIKKKIEASTTLSDKAKTNRISAICTIIVAVLSIIEIVAFRCGMAYSFEPLCTKELYIEILSAIAFSKIAYMAYEGVGPISIKKWLHALIDKIKTKADKMPIEEKDSIQDWIKITQSVLVDTLHMPMTDEQMETLKKALEEKHETENTNEVESKS